MGGISSSVRFELDGQKGSSWYIEDAAEGGDAIMEEINLGNVPIKDTVGEKEIQPNLSVEGQTLRSIQLELKKDGKSDTDFDDDDGKFNKPVSTSSKLNRSFEINKYFSNHPSALPFRQSCDVFPINQRKSSPPFSEDIDPISDFLQQPTSSSNITVGDIAQKEISGPILGLGSPFETSETRENRRSPHHRRHPIESNVDQKKSSVDVKKRNVRSKDCGRRLKKSARMSIGPIEIMTSSEASDVLELHQSPSSQTIVISDEDDEDIKLLPTLAKDASKTSYKKTNDLFDSDVFHNSTTMKLPNKLKKRASRKVPLSPIEDFPLNHSHPPQFTHQAAHVIDDSLSCSDIPESNVYRSSSSISSSISLQPKKIATNLTSKSLFKHKRKEVISKPPSPKSDIIVIDDISEDPESEAECTFKGKKKQPIGSLIFCIRSS